MFTYNHGENINSSGDEMSWASNTFDGCAIVDRKLKIGDVVKISVKGGLSGGHIILGITNMTDEQIKESIRKGTKIDVLTNTHIKVFKNEANFSLEVNSDNEIVQKGEHVSKLQIQPGNTYKLCAMLLFGFMDVTIIDGQPKTFQWCPSLCGTNVGLSSDKKNVSLKNGNPHAVGAWSDPLVQNNTIGFEVSSVNARWYYVKILVSPKPPLEAGAQGWESFINNELQTVVKIKNPKEQLIITLHDSTMTFVVGVNSVHSLDVNVICDGAIYLYFELFRVKLKVKAMEDIDEYEDSYSNFTDHPMYDLPNVMMDPVLKVKEPGEVQTSERASANLDKLNEVLSKQDTGSSKLSEIYNFIKKFDKDLSSVESQYQEPEGARPLPAIPYVQNTKYKARKGSSVREIGSASSVCSTCTSSITKNTNSYKPMESISTNGEFAEDASGKASQAPQLPTIYVRGGNEDLKLMIRNLQKRVADLERKKKISIVSSVDMYL